MVSALKAIREKCLNCSGYQRQEVKLCTVKDCALHSLRMGCSEKAYGNRLIRRYRNGNKGNLA